MANDTEQLPDRIKERLWVLQEEINQIHSQSSALLKTEIPNPISFEFRNSAPRDVLTPYEQAQAISFVTRYEHLPKGCKVQLGECQGKYYITNMDALRHALHEYRPIIQNESDSVYYQKIHRAWHQMLMLDDDRKGTTIRIYDTQQNDVTPIFTRWLCEHNEALSLAMRPLDYGYLYNGILQHSDASYSERFLRDYTSGDWNYVLWKHVHVLGFIHKMLAAYYPLIAFLARPTPGPL